ncbi:MAG TPA: hypothetical protein VFA10_21380 [Ktedonobacteraceae bacterium]|nr:hypothetical protein [Ktedonobacteraceae bacterium]
MKKQKSSNSLPAEILAKIQEYQERPVPLLDEMTPEEVISCCRQMLVWLDEAGPRTVRYLRRRALQGQSNNLDQNMVEDVWWHRFFQGNFTRLLQQHTTGHQDTIPPHTENTDVP